MAQISLRILLCAETQQRADELAKPLHQLGCSVVESCGDVASACKSFEHVRPNVVIFAMPRVADAERCYIDIYAKCTLAQIVPHVSMVLCPESGIAEASRKCDERVFDQCQLVWDNQAGASTIGYGLSQLAEMLASPDTMLAPEQKMKLFCQRCVEQVEVGAVGESKDSYSAVKKILLIDDDEFQHKTHRRIFPSDEYEVVSAMSVVSALHSLGEQLPDVILMDYEMPVLNGVDGVSMMRALPALQETPILMLTGNSNRALVKQCLVAGANDFVVKPFKRDALLGKVSRCLNAA